MRQWELERTETGYLYLTLDSEADQMNGGVIGPMWNEEVAEICLRELRAGTPRGKLRDKLRAYPWFPEMVAAQPDMGWDEDE